MIRQRAGYTIVEVMIFLAVTGGLFVIAFTAFDGQHQKTQFNQAVRDMELKLQDWINDVNTGYYPAANINCSPNTSTPPTVTLSNNQSTDNQGQHEGCIFIGKSVFFVDETNVQTGIIVGNRQTNATPTTLREVRTLEESHPTLVDNLVDDFETPYRMPIKKVFLANTMPNASLTGFAIVSSFGQTLSSGDLVSGSTTSRVIPITGEVGEVPPADFKASIQGMQEPTTVPAITVCIQSEYESQKWGVILIGKNGAQLSTTSFITEDPASVGCTT